MNLVRGAFLLLIATRTGLELVIGLVGRAGDGGFSLGAVLNVLAIVLGIAALPYLQRTSVKIPLIIWGPYLMVLVFSVLFISATSDGIRLFFSTLTFPAVFVASYLLLRTREDVADLFLCIILSSVIPVLMALGQIAAGGLGERIQSSFNHPNVFAFYLVGVICAILYYKSFGLRLGAIHVGLNAYIVVLAGLLLTTQTRSAWAALAVFGAIYALTVDRKLLFALPLVPAVLFVPVVADRLNGISNTEPVTLEEIQRGTVQANSYAWREVLWTRALIDSADNRLIGKGFGTLGVNAPHFFPLAQGASEAHSAYVQSLYEIGYLGLFSYIWTYVGTMLAVILTMRRAYYLGWISIAFVIVNLIVNYSDNLPYYLSYNWYVWAFLGADLALRSHILPAAVRRARSDALVEHATAAAT